MASSRILDTVKQNKLDHGVTVSFRFATSPLLINGQGSASSLGLHVAAEALTLVITDPGLYKMGLLDKSLNSLEQACKKVVVFSDVESDPSSETVERAAELAVSNGINHIVGFGGGSSMDVAKLVAALSHPDSLQSLEDIYGVDQFVGKRLPLIQVPTTAGTGSEVTPVAVVTTGQSTKAGVVSERLLPDVAVLDASLTVGLPGAITAATGIDAMVHAIEAFTSKHKKNLISDMFAIKALELLAPNVLQAVNNGTDLEAREKMLLGANLAGQAFANAPVAAVHALAYPLGGIFHIPHGLSNALVLPHVMRFNMGGCSQLYGELADVILPDLEHSDSAEVRARRLIDWLEQLTAATGLPTRLSEAGVKECDLENLASEAMKQQRLLINNPVDVRMQDALNIYRAAY